MTRERRTLVGLLVVPLLSVVIFAFAHDEITNQVANQSQVVHTVAVSGASGAPKLVAFLRTQRLRITPTNDVRATIRDRRAPVGLALPARADEAIRKGRPVSVTVYVGERTFANQFARAALLAALESYGRDVLRARVRAAGLPPDSIEPLRIRDVDLTSTQQRSGSVLGDILPFLLVGQVVGLMSGIASDLTAGEKERRTVEALLVTPLSRREIVAAKWLVVAALGTAAGLLTMAATLVTFHFVSSSALLGVTRAVLPAGAVPKTILAVIALAVSVSAAQVVIGVFARSQQQAGIFMTPLIFLPFIFLAFVQTRSGTTFGAGPYAIPLLGPMLLARNGLSGTAAALAPAVVGASSLAYAAAGLAFADRLFRSERALLRAGG